MRRERAMALGVRLAWAVGFGTSSGWAGEVALWSVDSMTRVFREQPARPRVEPVLKAARGEWEAFQVVVAGSPRDLRGVRVEAQGAQGAAGGAPLPSPVVLREHYVRVAESSPQTSLPAGDYPDALVPQDFPEADLPASAWVNQPFWVDVFVPYGTAPGSYEGQVTARFQDGRSERLTYRVEVWPFDLPVVPRMKSSFWLTWRRVAEVHGFDRNAGEPHPHLIPILEAYETLLAEHRLSIDQVRASYPEAASGRLNKDEVERALRRHLLHRHAASIALPMFPHWPFEDPLGRDRKAAQAYLAEWMGLLHRFGCGERGYIALGDLDEPNDAAAYERVRQWGAMVNEAEQLHGVRLPLMITEQPEPDDASWGRLEGAADIWVPHFSAVYQDLEDPAGKREIAQRLAAGEEVWTYAALVQLSESWKERHGFPKVVTEGHPPVWMTDYPPINHRILPWLMRLHGITGLAYWDVLHYPEDVDPWREAGTFRNDGETFNGDGFYIYPATRRRHGQDQPVASMRLKWLRDAAEDFDYLTLAAEAGGEARARELTATFARGFGDWKDDVPALLQAREELGRMIAARSGAGAGNLNPQTSSSP